MLFRALLKLLIPNTIVKYLIDIGSLHWAYRNGTRNGNWKWNWKQKCSNHWCSVFFVDSWVVCFVIALVFYLAMVMWLVLWVVGLWLHIQCDWVALLWQAMLQSSLQFTCERGARDKTSCNLTMRVISLGLGTRPAFLPHSFIPWPFPQLQVLIACNMWSKWWLHTQALYYTSGSLIPNHCRTQYLPIQKY